jgi:hypothetical protein
MKTEMKPIKNCSKEGEGRIRNSSRGDEFYQGTLYICMEIPQ